MAKEEEKLAGKKKKRKKTTKKKLVLKDNQIPTEVHKNSAHIRDLKDIKELIIQVNPHYKPHTVYNQLSLGDARGSRHEQGKHRVNRELVLFTESFFLNNLEFIEDVLRIRRRTS